MIPRSGCKESCGGSTYPTSGRNGEPRRRRNSGGKRTERERDLEGGCKRFQSNSRSEIFRFYLISCTYCSNSSIASFANCFWFSYFISYHVHFFFLINGFGHVSSNSDDRIHDRKRSCFASFCEIMLHREFCKNLFYETKCMGQMLNRRFNDDSIRRGIGIFVSFFCCTLHREYIFTARNQTWKLSNVVSKIPRDAWRERGETRSDEDFSVIYDLLAHSL